MAAALEGAVGATGRGNLPVKLHLLFRTRRFSRRNVPLISKEHPPEANSPLAREIGPFRASGVLPVAQGANSSRPEMFLRPLKLAKVPMGAGRKASTVPPSSHPVRDMVVPRTRRRIRRVTTPDPAAGPEEGEADVRDHLHAIEAAAREFEEWKSTTTLADRIRADQIRAALKAMLFPS